jgi:hypothetical protein
VPVDFDPFFRHPFRSPPYKACEYLFFLAEDRW